LPALIHNENPFEKNPFFGLAYAVKKIGQKNLYEVILLWCETYFFYHKKIILLK